MTIYFADNFKGNVADSWELESGWRVEHEELNYLLCGEGHSWARLRKGEDWTNYSFQFRLKILQGVIHANYRLSERGRYFIGFHEKGLYLKKEAPWGKFFDLKIGYSQHDFKVWRNIEIKGDVNHLQVYVDRVLEIDFTDADPLIRGSIAFETLDDAHVFIESVNVSDDSNFKFEEILQVNQSLQRYHFRLEYKTTDGKGIIYEVEMNLETGRQYIQIGLISEEFPTSEVFWEGERGYGRRLESGFWLCMQGKPFPNLLQLAVKALLAGQIVTARKDGAFWFVDLESSPDSQRHDPADFFHALFGEPAGREQEEFLAQLVELSEELVSSLQMRISCEDYMIAEVTVQSQARDIRTRMVATFGPSQMEVHPIPDEAPQTCRSRR